MAAESQAAPKARKRRPAAPWSILVDTREQRPWDFGPLIDEHGLPFVVEAATLRSGDYVLREAPGVVVERKSLGDLVGCVGHGRERFERELARLAMEARHRILVIESTVAEVELHRYRGDVTPAQVIGSVLGWALSYDVMPIWAGDAEAAARLVLRMFGMVRRRMLRIEE